MSEYTSDPVAVEAYLASRARTANWIATLGPTVSSPSVAPSLVSDTEDGLSSPDDDSDAESSHSQPPRMVLRWPDGRPDVPVSHPQAAQQWSAPHKPQQQQPLSSHTQRSRSASQAAGYPPSNPYIRHPPSVGALYIPPPPPPVFSPQPETIQIHPSPTRSQLGRPAYPSPTSAHSTHPAYPSPTSAHSAHPPPAPSASSRSRSMHSNGSSTRGLQMIYTPPAPASPASPSIVSPSPVYAYPNAGARGANPEEDSTPTPHYPQQSQQHSTYGGSMRRPATSHHTGHHAPHHAPSSAHRSPSHHSHSSSHSHSQHSSHGHHSHASSSHRPPAIVYAPAAHAPDSGYSYNPPRILPSHSNPSNHSADAYGTYPHDGPHAPRKLGPSISDPTTSRARGRLLEVFSRTPSPSLHPKGRRGMDDDGDSVSSGSTYYVIPSAGQKVRVVPPTPSQSYPTSPTRNRHQIYAAPPPESPTQKRPLLQRIFHPHIGGGGSTPSAGGSDGGRRVLRRRAESTTRM
ncbi:hypothetical protein FA95DRAFT_1573169 [Auriscalpium vulgare]|uniref:Uncharacterized protein n=1 Tax=Auriscalpium vulgare TaxID=40419 RepID=A0ACB8RQ62_9AGAM|nr:hypothetical protein FA95DRAFT_1573169 [Auriscalpium vulgare]